MRTELPRSIKINNTGAKDASQGIMAAIEWLGETRANYSIGYASGRTKRLVLPDGIYRIDTPLEWDADIALDLGGESFFGAHLNNNTGGDWIINCRGKAIGTLLALRNMLFVNGGIKLWERWRGELIIDGIKVHNSPSWGLVFEDGTNNEPSGSAFGPVNWVLSNSQFYKCGQNHTTGGVGMMASTHVLGTIDRCRFIDCSGTPLLIDGIGVHVINCDFTRIDRLSTRRSYIWFKGVTDSAADSVVEKTRFGKESSLTEKVPEACIELGVEGGGGIISSLTFRDNWFNGVQTPGPGEGDCAVLVHEKPLAVAFDLNHVTMEYRTTINQTWIANPVSPTVAETADRRCRLDRWNHYPLTGAGITVDNGDGILLPPSSAIGWTTLP